jgi:hypothetical protein
MPVFRRVPGIWLASALALAATGAGCAVMTVDVDVYKGPLANHPETQLQQFAAYAIGVKHLLVSLRNDFEFGLNPTPQESLIIRKIGFDFVLPGKPESSGKIQTSSDGTQTRYTFNDEHSRLLNSVLSMYKDLGEEDIQPYLARLDVVWKSFEANLALAKGRGANAQRARMDAAKNLADLWYLAIDALTSVHSAAFYKPDDADDQRRQKKVTELLATPLATLTQPSSLACAIHVLSGLQMIDQSKSVPLSASVLSRELGDSPFSIEAERRAAAVIEDAIRANPADTVVFLRQLHERFKEVRDTEIPPAGSLPQYCERAAPNRRVYGVVRGERLQRYGTAEVGQNNEDIDTINKIVNALQGQFAVLEANAGQGFEVGRLGRGIETLTNAYLKALERRSAKEIKQTGTELQDSLIAFAEKVRTVANHHAVFSLSPDRARGDSGAGSQRARIQREVFLLQALGNTLLSFADELRVRGEHEQRGRQRGVSERHAQERAFAVSSFESFETLRSELRARAKRAGDDAQRLKTQLDALEAKTKSPAAQTGTDIINTADAEQAQALRLKAGVEPAAAAYVVLSAASLPGFDHLYDANTLIKLGEVRAKLRKELTVAGATPGADAFVASMRDTLRSESEVYAGGPANLKNLLAQANSYLETLENGLKAKPKATVTLAGRSRSALYDRVQEIARQAVEAKRAGWDDYEKRAARSRAKLDDQAKASRITTDSIADLRAKLAVAVAEGAAFEKTLGTVTTLREPLFRTLDSTNAEIGHDAMLQALTRLLQERSTAQTEPAKADFAAALETINKLGGAPSAAVARLRTGEKTGSESQRDALDNVLDLLGNELIAAERVGNTERARSLRSAIAAANQRRADLAFIRPASAYLRNSNAATTLQSDPQVFWRNMLGEHGYRTLLPTALSGSLEDQEVSRVRAEVDKQFWQTINTVRVAGAGKTDYVIAKDDIGNWYVKAYEADPSSIIKAAQGLAMFNLGKGLDMNLLRSTEISEQLRDPNISDTRRSDLEAEQQKTREGSKAGSEPLSRVLIDYKNRYREQLRAHARSVRAYALSADASLMSAWRSTVPDLPQPGQDRLLAIAKAKASMLSGAASSLSDDELANAATPLASRTLATLHDLKRYALSVELDVAGEPVLVEEAVRTATSKAADLETRRGALAGRTQTLEERSRAVAFERDLLARMDGSQDARDKQNDRIRQATDQETEAKRLQVEADDVFKKAQAENEKARVALSAANKQRAALALATRESILSYVRGIAEQRLVEIARYEQAVHVVQGAASPPPKQ